MSDDTAQVGEGTPASNEQESLPKSEEIKKSGDEALKTTKERVNEAFLEAAKKKKQDKEKSNLQQRKEGEGLKENTKEIKPESEEKKEPKAPKKKAAEEEKSESEEPKKVKQKYLPPKSLKKELHESYNKLPDDLKSFINERDYQTQADYSRNMQEINKERKAFEPYKEIEIRHNEYFKQHGVSATQAVDNAINIIKTLDNDPIRALKHIIATKGVDVLDLIDEQGQVTQEPQQQPRVNVEQIKEEARQAAKAEMQQAVQAELQRQTVGTLQQEIDSFMADKPFNSDVSTRTQFEYF